MAVCPQRGLLGTQKDTWGFQHGIWDPLLGLEAMKSTSYVNLAEGIWELKLTVSMIGEIYDGTRVRIRAQDINLPGQ